MSNFRLIAAGVDVSGINRELDAQPELWGAHTGRTAAPDSPHRGVPDIWVRWRDPRDGGGPGPHQSVFYPPWAALPSLRPIVFNLMRAVCATQLGGILITKTPAGGQVAPHVDGGWHAEHYGTKLYLVLRSDPRCLHHCGGDVENFRQGDVWEYPNNVLHSVENAGTGDHVNAIICMRTEH